MKAPLSWLSDYFTESLDWREISEALTLAGIEVEHVQTVGATDPKVVAAAITRVEAVRTAPGLKKLVIFADRERTVLSNAPELLVGQKLAVALPGATLFQAPELGLFQVAETQLYGERSEAVVVHAAHLGFGPDQERAIDLGSAEPGEPVLQAWAGGSQPGGDRVLWLSILPNIARCQAIRGVAGEIAALLGRSLREPPPAPELGTKEPLAPAVLAKDACRVLSVTLLENVAVTRSPEWLMRRLVLAGMTPINNVVDASNYVMLELGQPTHPYDADRLASLDLAVRAARPGESLLTLQQAEADEPTSLPEGAPVIVSEDVPVALAGVIGGRATAISGATERVLLEAAAFEWAAIRKSQRLTRVYTEASARFSRGVNPELPQSAARRFVEILKESSPELTVRAFGEASEGLPEPRLIELSLAELSASLGCEVPLESARQCLLRVGLKVEPDAALTKLRVSVGNARPDLTLPCDLVEEIARLRGYDRIPETMPIEPITQRLHEDHRDREVFRDQLVRAGLDEILSYSLSSPDAEARLNAGRPHQPPKPAVSVLNPVSPERSMLRTSLVPGLLQAAALNLRSVPGCRLFELGVVFQPGSTIDAVPRESEHATVLIAGKLHAPSLHEKHPRSVDFFDLQAIARHLARSTGLVADPEFDLLDQPPYRPGAAARILSQGNAVGTLGAVHPMVLRAFDLEGQSVFVLEFWLEALRKERPSRLVYREYDRQPSIELDIAMILARSISASRVRQVVLDTGGPLLRDVEAFDQFFDGKFGQADKSLAIRLRLNGGERTLEMTDALEVRERVARALEATLGAQIRE